MHTCEEWRWTRAGGHRARRRARWKRRTPGIALIPSTKLMLETCRGGSECARVTVCASRRYRDQRLRRRSRPVRTGKGTTTARCYLKNFGCPPRRAGAAQSPRRAMQFGRPNDSGGRVLWKETEAFLAGARATFTRSRRRRTTRPTLTHSPQPPRALDDAQRPSARTARPSAPRATCSRAPTPAASARASSVPRRMRSPTAWSRRASARAPPLPPTRAISAQA